MVAIIDSRASGKVLLIERRCIAGRATAIATLTAGCLLMASVRAGDFTAPERKFDEAESSLPEEADAFSDTGLDATVLQIRVALTGEFKTGRIRDYSN